MSDTDSAKLSPDLKQIAKWIFNVLKYACYFMMAWSLYGLSYFIISGEYQLPIDGVRVTGEIIDVIQQSIRSYKQHIIGSTAYIPIVEFSPANSNKVIKFKDNYGRGRIVPVKGAHVEVLYIEKNPEIAIIDKGPFLNWLGQYFRVGVLLLAFFSLASIRKQIRNLDTK